MTRATNVCGAAFVAVAVVVGVTCCSADRSDIATHQEPVLSSNSVVQYQYSEPNRQYSMRIQPDAVAVTVNNRSTEVRPLPPGVWDKLNANVGTVRQLSTHTAPSCGGGARQLSIAAAGRNIVDQRFPVCDKTNVIPAKQVDTFIKPVIEALPDWNLILHG